MNGVHYVPVVSVHACSCLFVYLCLCDRVWSGTRNYTSSGIGENPWTETNHKNMKTTSILHAVQLFSNFALCLFGCAFAFLCAPHMFVRGAGYICRHFLGQKLSPLNKIIMENG